MPPWQSQLFAFSTWAMTTLELLTSRLLLQQKLVCGEVTIEHMGR